MAIERIKLYDIMKLTSATTVDEAKNNLDKLEENELIIILTERKLGIKIAGKLFITNLEEVI